MASTVTFSSSAYENDDASPTTRFTTFTLQRGARADEQVLERINNRIISGRPAGLSFAGASILNVADDLESIEARGVTGPRGNMAGEREAVVMEGELVTLSLTHWDGTPLTETGIITDLNIQAGPGGRNSWRADLVFHRIDHLLFHNSSLVLRASAA